jgi:hypothetical protein
LVLSLNVLWSEKLPMIINYKLGRIPITAVMAHFKAISQNLLKGKKKLQSIQEQRCGTGNQ